MNKNIAIVGGSPSWVNAPFNNDDWDIWVLGNQMDRYEGKRVSRIFEIHDNLDEHDPSYPEWLVSHNIPMVVSDKFPIKNKNTIVFNYRSALEMIGENFSSSPAVMMAQANIERATQIAIYGVDMALDEHEYFMQRPCMEQWIGFSRGRGITVSIDDSSPLGYTCYREGRDWPDRGFTGFDEGDYRKMYDKHAVRFKELESQINEIAPGLEQMKAEFHALSGAMQVYDRLQKLHRAKSGGLDVGVDSGQNNR